MSKHKEQAVEVPDEQPAGKRPEARRGGTPGTVSRREALRRQNVQRQRRRAVLYGSGVLALVLVIAGVYWLSSRGQASCPAVQDPLRGLYNTLPRSDIAGRVKLVVSPYSKDLPAPGPELEPKEEGRQHVSDPVITYATNPPASGPHYEEAADYTFNTTEVNPGNWVHSLEHGAIVVLYSCSSGRVTAIAWDHELPLAGPDAPKITEFYNKYVDRGPEKAP